MKPGGPSTRRAPAVAATVLFVATVWGLKIAGDSVTWLALVADLLTGGLTVVTIILCLRAGRRVRSAGWSFLMAAAVIWGLADLLRLFVDGTGAPFPSINDAAYAVGMVPLLIGTWRLCQDGSTRREQMRSLFDGLLIASSLVLVFWWSVLGVIRSQELGVAGTTLALCYVLGDVLVVTTVQSSRHVADPARHDLRLFGAAFVMSAGADALFTYQFASSSYGGAWLPDLGWLAAYALVAWAAHLAKPPGHNTERRRVSELYLYGSIGAAVAVTASSLVVRARLEAVQGWGLVALAVIGIARHYASQRENEELSRRLEEQFRALSVSEARFRRVFDGTVDGIAVIDRSARFMAVNASLARMLERPVDELVGVDASTLLEPDEREELIAVATEAGGELLYATTTVRTASGVALPVETTVSNMADDPAVGGFVVTARDISERVRRQRELSESKERFRRSFDAAPIGMVLVSSAGTIIEANGAYATMLGRPVDQLVGAAVLDFTHRDDIALEVRHVETLLASGDTQKQWEKRLVHAHGHHVWVSITISVVHLPNGDHEFINQVEDITERRATLVELAHNARHDLLTGIPNRAHFEEQLAIALERAAITESRVAVAFLDVDRFKIVNDNLGHRYGDELLRVVATRLSESTRSGDIVARFGGDEFTAMFCNVPDESVAMAIAQRLIDRVCRPIELDDGETFVSLSVGIALSVPSMDATAVDLMLSNADAAMYRAKEAGRDRIELHVDTSDRSSVNRLRLANDLHRALERDEMRMHYQPVVRLETGEIRSCEALLRWEHGLHGMLPPAQFMHLAEDSGLVVPIGNWTIERACRQLAAWNFDHPGRAMRCSVNLSSRQLDTGNVTQTTAQLIDETGIDPDWLWFEITESTLMRETTEAIATMRRLRELGVHLAIDDFGTGYSSLAYLRRFPVEALKIDRSFVGGLGANDEDTTIVRAVVELAHALGLSAVAEGVETEAQCERLRTIGCELAQGWLFGMPAAAGDVDDPRSSAAWPRPQDQINGSAAPR